MRFGTFPAAASKMQSEEDGCEKPRGGEALFEGLVFANLSYQVGN